MDFSSVTQVAFFSASIISVLLTGLLFHKAQEDRVLLPLAYAAVAHSLWCLGLGLHHLWQNLPQLLLLLEFCHFAGWLIATLWMTNTYCPDCLPKAYSRCVGAALAAFLLAAGASLTGVSWLPIQALFALQGLTLAIIGLLNIEQLYRNVTSIRLIKLVCLNLAGVFIYDVYFFSQSLIQPSVDAGFFQIRAAVSIVACLFIGLAAITLKHSLDQAARLSLSRPVVFYTTSLTLAGTLLAVVGLGGYYVRAHGGEWGSVTYALLLAAALMAIIFVFAYPHAREKLTVLINKHLFSHKYDYRSEWLKLIELLSQPASADDVHKRAFRALAGIFKCSGGALWLHKGKVLAPVYQHNISMSILEAIEPDSSPFVNALAKSEWVFLPSSKCANDPLSQYNELLPPWIEAIEGIWLILPLISETRLIGFMVLTSPKGDGSLNWEDLDLLKTVGRQVANYLLRHEQTEQLAEARQFDAFNKLAAYVMHDLKNLIAQQSLVVKNAEKHKDNPAFVDDAIQTINNSVVRMNTLLRKLQRNEPESVRVLNLNEVLVEAVKRCQKGQPQPTLRNEFSDLRVKADWDSLVMVFIHLIHNAQDATPASGFIDLEVEVEGTMVNIIIEDNGEGMDEDFLRNRLFKPFDTTKTGKGMGIGVYQVRDYVQTLSGNMAVTSTPNEGTTFTVSLPLVAQ